MNKFFIILGLLSINALKAQVGINTDQPKATLDISTSPIADNKVDGVLIPRITGDDLKEKSSLYTADQKGLLLYVTSPVTTPEDKTLNVTKEGFYYYDSTKEKWMLVNGGGGSDIWMTQRKVETDTIRPVTNTTEDIFRTGKVAVGFDGIDTWKLDGNGQTEIMKRRSYFNFDLMGNYNIKSGMYDSDNPFKGFWYIDQIVGNGFFSDFNKAKGALNAKNGEVDFMFKGTSFENHISSIGASNKAEGLEFLPTLRLRTHGEWDNALYPYILSVFPDQNLTLRKSNSFTVDTPNTSLMRNWDFNSSVMNSFTMGYVEGQFNLQTLRIPEQGDPTGDSSVSFSRLLIKKPWDHNNSIILENNNVIKDAANDIFSVKNSLLVDKDGIHFIAKNFTYGVAQDVLQSSYTFPRSSPNTNNVYLGIGKDWASTLTWNPLPTIFNNSYGEVESGLFPTVYSGFSATTFEAADRLFNIGNGQSETSRSDALTILKNGVASLPSIDNTKIENADAKVIITKEYLDVRVPKPPVTGNYTLVSRDGMVSWEVMP